MSEETMSAIVGKTLAAAQTCVFGFQGGEPTLAGLSFYKRFTHLVEEQKRPEQKVAYTIQTNGTELDEEWFAFLKEKDFLVGLSMDGVEKPTMRTGWTIRKKEHSPRFSNVPGNWRNTGSPSMCCAC